MPKRPACGRPTTHSTGEPCPYPRVAGKQRCLWHVLLAADPATQAEAANQRLLKAELSFGYQPRARVPKEEWPPGERWCSGCQSFVPFFYCQGSRCRACNSAAAHAGHVEKTYGLEPGEYDALLDLQGGRCYICHRKPKTKRLAVDHDHDTGRVRGLLCADSERGCNAAVLGGLSTAKDGALAAARRAVEYLEHTPYDRLRGAEPARERRVESAWGNRPSWMS